MTVRLLVENAGWVLALMVGLWVISVARRDASIVDPWWSIAFLLVAGRTAAATGLTPAKTLLLALVAAWAVRLWLHLLLRSRGHGEDPRYQAFRRRYGARYWWISLFQVFLFQGTLALLIAAPLELSAAAAAPDPVTWVHVAGACVFAVGFTIEAVADAQLQSFRRRKRADHEVFDQGLFRYSRHPNYFGEALLWWGFWLCALGRPYGAVTVLSPLLMTFLLVRVSGVSLLDEHLSRTKPGYADYMRRTSSFVPLPPRS